MILIDHALYTEEEIKHMSLKDLKMLASFTEDERSLRALAICSENPAFIVYIDNLCDKVFNIKEINKAK